MKTSTSIVFLTISILTAETASANQMYLNLGALTDGSSYDEPQRFHTVDANTTTAVFPSLGFNTIKATSIYDMTDGSVYGSFIDTNDTSVLTSYGISTSITAPSIYEMTTSITATPDVVLTAPDCVIGECDIDTLNDINTRGDHEGFGQTWDIQVQYRFEGFLSTDNTITFTGGYLDIYFNEYENDTTSGIVLGGTNEKRLLRAEVTGSELVSGNLDLFFDITSAVDDFFWIDNGRGTYLDPYDTALIGEYATMRLDTNIDPPIPTTDKLLLLPTNFPITVGTPYAVAAIRQTELDGSIRMAIPEPTTLALLGIGLFGVGIARRNIKTI
ncbi:hypothetical protein CKO09_01305 [Chromatium weissei]|nr:hypothetical protein [Chromatium weissei]